MRRNLDAFVISLKSRHQSPHAMRLFNLDKLVLFQMLLRGLKRIVRAALAAIFVAHTIFWGDDKKRLTGQQTFYEGIMYRGLAFYFGQINRGPRSDIHNGVDLYCFRALKGQLLQNRALLLKFRNNIKALFFFMPNSSMKYSKKPKSTVYVLHLR